MGSSKTPEMPAQPTASQNMQDWITNYPAMFEMQQKYAPQEAQQQVDIAQQYALPYAQALKSAQDTLYPQTAGLQEQLAGQAAQGMSSQMPEWMRQQYQSNMNAQLGNNVAAPIGADYSSRGLMQQQEDWKRYYQNLGLSVTNRQPLTQAQSPQYSNYAGGYTPGSVAGNNQQSYGTAMQGWSNSLNNSGGNMGGMGAAIGAGAGLLLAPVTAGSSLGAATMGALPWAGLGGMMGGSIGSQFKY